MKKKVLLLVSTIAMLLILMITVIQIRKILENPYGLEIVSEDVLNYKTNTGQYNEEYPWEVKTLRFGNWGGEYVGKEVKSEKNESSVDYFISSLVNLKENGYLRIEPYGNGMGFGDYTLVGYREEDESYRWQEQDLYISIGDELINAKKDLFIILCSYGVDLSYIYEVTYILDCEYGFWVPCYVNLKIDYYPIVSLFISEGEIEDVNRLTHSYVFSENGISRSKYTISSSLYHEKGLDMSNFGLDQIYYEVETTEEQEEMAKVAFAKYRGRKQIFEVSPYTSYYDYETGKKIKTVKRWVPDFPIIVNE